MTGAALRPNATTSNTGTLTGGVTAHAVLSDDSDASYVTFTSGQAATLGFTDLTLPAGAVIKSLSLSARTARVATTGTLSGLTSIGTGTPFQTTVNWSVATITLLRGEFLVGTTDAAVDAVTVTLSAGSGGSLRVYEVYLVIAYVTKPVTDVTAPTGTITATNLPATSWTNTLDSEGGAQTFYEVKIFSAAQYGAGGFSADTSTSTLSSGILSGSATTWTPTTPIANATYRSYVRVAQTVNGVATWSDWDFLGFTISASLPAAPTFTATADNTNARITLAFDDNSGTATTDAFEVQRSLDGGTTWETVRQLVAGLLTPAAGLFTLYDYEAPNGVQVSYQGRALHNNSGLYVASAWVARTATWTSGSWWLKHPNLPTLNRAVTIRSFPELQRAGRQGVFQALGATNAVVVSDTRGPKTGTVTLRSDTIAAQTALDALLDEDATLMLQGPANSGGPDYIHVTNHARQRVVDAQSAIRVFEALDVVVVASPSGDVAAWPP